MKIDNNDRDIEELRNRVDIIINSWRKISETLQPRIKEIMDNLNYWWESLPPEVKEGIKQLAEENENAD